jgi:hypothetical protein
MMKKNIVFKREYINFSCEMELFVFTSFLQ